MKKLFLSLALLFALSISIFAGDGNMGATFTADAPLCGNMGATYTGQESPDPCTSATADSSSSFIQRLMELFP